MSLVTGAIPSEAGGSRGTTENLIVTSFQNNNNKQMQIYFMNSGEEQQLISEIGAGQKVEIRSLPAHVFVVYDMQGIQRETFVVTSSKKKQTFRIRNYDMVEAVFYNNMPEGSGDIEVFWLNDETKDGYSNGWVKMNHRLKVNTQTGHRFAVYNKDRSFRMDFNVTAQTGHSQLFVIQNRVEITLQNPKNSKHPFVQLYWINNNNKDSNIKKDEEYEHHQIGIAVKAGESFHFYAEPNHKFVAYRTTEDGKHPESMVGDFSVTSSHGETQVFTVGG
eukprot:CAMPEP_0194135798 /NCGR_PEP_ID=MMETSP0152-20130528/5874_1 /TAXON_ID=1049557 /ORGANISM="Thalassiothrix antarctica, Strain L6-D1" /LENGTH=275 /DNA_ID=CAMNT_0038832197 /DNA_START=78 /DNA_END=905 /DNA_ORIENTATION=+